VFCEENSVEVEAEEPIPMSMHCLNCSFTATTLFSDSICHVWTPIPGCSHELRVQTVISVGRSVENPIKELVAVLSSIACATRKYLGGGVAEISTPI
jgi:hypothetical protein